MKIKNNPPILPFLLHSVTTQIENGPHPLPEREALGRGHLVLLMVEKSPELKARNLNEHMRLLYASWSIPGKRVHCILTLMSCFSEIMQSSKLVPCSSSAKYWQIHSIVRLRYECHKMEERVMQGRDRSEAYWTQDVLGIWNGPLRVPDRSALPKEHSATASHQSTSLGRDIQMGLYAVMPRNDE